MLKIISTCLLLTLPAISQATIIIHDDFNDSNLTTNTAGVGTGFDSVGQNVVSESGTDAFFSPGGSATTVITSKDSFNAFQTGVTTRTEWALTDASRTFSEYRTWVGLRNASSGSDHFLPGVQGIYVSVFQQSGDILGPNTTQGNLVSTNSSGGSTVLATWDWAGFTTSSGLLDIILDTTDSSYDLSFSQSVNLQTGSLSGSLNLGTLPASFEVGAHNQWGGNTLAIDAITVSTLDEDTLAVPLPSTLFLMVSLAAVIRFRLSPTFKI